MEIKSFAVIDEQADGGKVAAAATQSAVYVLALRRLLGDDKVSHEIVLVCPKDFSNQPAATKVDVRKQLIVLRTSSRRLTRIDALLDALPAGPDVRPRARRDGRPTRPLPISRCAQPHRRPVRARLPGTCEMAFFCRDEAARLHRGAGPQSVRNSAGWRPSPRRSAWPTAP